MTNSTSLKNLTENIDHKLLEPDGAWKEALRAEIEDNLVSSMVFEASKKSQVELDKGSESPSKQKFSNGEHDAAIMAEIRALAEETFEFELERERQERRWAAGFEMTPQWKRSLVQEQREIMGTIQGGPVLSVLEEEWNETRFKELMRRDYATKMVRVRTGMGKELGETSMGNKEIPESMVQTLENREGNEKAQCEPQGQDKGPDKGPDRPQEDIAEDWHNNEMNYIRGPPSDAPPFGLPPPYSSNSDEKSLYDEN